MILEYTVTPSQEGKRVDSILRRDLSISSSAIRRAKWADHILLNGQSVHTNHLVHEGDVLQFISPDGETPVYVPCPFETELSIPYEDEDLMVIDKRAGMAVQTSQNHPDDALENALYAYFGRPDGFIFRPVNRLDKGTSGLMLVAKNGIVQHLLQRQLHSPELERRYLAVTDGVPEKREDTICLPIGKEDSASIRRIITPDGRESITHYTVLREHGGRALLRLRLETGRTHQIRVHLSAIGCPVFGDFLYGKESDELPGRCALHSHALTFRHPVTREVMHLESPLPEELSRLLS